MIISAIQAFAASRGFSAVNLGGGELELWDGTDTFSIWTFQVQDEGGFWVHMFSHREDLADGTDDLSLAIHRAEENARTRRKSL